MTGTLIFGGVSSADYGVSVDMSQSFATPAKHIETAHVPGQNGDIILYNPGTYENVTISYPCFIQSSFPDRFHEFITRLYSLSGWQILRDSAHPGMYRQAYLVQAVTPQTGVYNRSGMFTLQFVCSVWWLDSGSTPIEYTENGTLTNPTQFRSWPKYYIEGVGTVTIGGSGITTTVSPTTITTQRYESDHPFTGSFIRIPPGTFAVELGEGITLLRITPFWWTI